MPEICQEAGKNEELVGIEKNEEKVLSEDDRRKEWMKKTLQRREKNKCSLLIDKDSEVVKLSDTGKVFVKFAVKIKP